MVLLGKKINGVLANALETCKPHFVNVMIFSLFLNVLYLTPTIYMLQVYNRVMPTGGLATLFFLSLITIIAFLVLAMLDNLRTRLLVRSGLKLDMELSGPIMTQILSMQVRSTEARSTTNVMRSFDSFKQAISGQGFLALCDAPWIVIYILLCFLLHPYLALVCLAGAVILTILAVMNERATYKQLTQATQGMARAYATQDVLTAKADVISALGMREAMVMSQMRTRHEAMESSLHAGMSGNRYRAAAKFFRLLLQSVGLGVGALLAVENKISPGAVFAASLLISRATAPIDQTIASWKSLVAGYNGFFSLNDLFNSVEAKPDYVRLPAPRGQLDLEGVSVANHELKTYLLANVSFSLQPGEVVGVIGPSGAGKTTLARVIVGAEVYDTGAVRVDNGERREWDPQRLAKYIGYFPQDTVLFEGTVRDNICRFDHVLTADMEAVDAAVVRAAQAAGVHELIMRLPHGYNTRIGINGQGLSAGQSQLIGLARAFYGEPSLLVLDEPNSHLDSAGEEMLAKAIAGFRAGGGSVVVIAHRAGILAVVDKLLVLQSGRVQYFGTREGWTKQLEKAAAKPAANLEKSGA